MEAFFSWLGIGFGTLFVVAVLVAWWEHVTRNGHRAVVAQAASGPRAVTVDVPLDQLQATPPSGDAAARRALLDDTLGRLTQTGAEAGRGTAWMETSPMVLQSSASGTQSTPDNKAGSAGA